MELNELAEKTYPGVTFDTALPQQVRLVDRAYAPKSKKSCNTLTKRSVEVLPTQFKRSYS